MRLMLGGFICLALVAFVFAFANAEEFSGGATILPIDEGLPQSAFNLKTDTASIYLEKAVLFKENGWITRDKEIAVTARMTINSQKKDRTSGSLTISRVYKFDVSIYDDGKIEIPLKSLPLLDTFRLSGSEYFVTSIIVDLSLSKKRDKTDFSKTLQTIIAVSKKIPVPGNPYVEFASVFGDSWSEVIDNAIKEGADTVPFASFGVRFLQGEKAAYYTEKPGVHAIVIGPSQRDSGALPLENLVGKNLSYDAVEGLKYQGSRLKNNHMIVRIIASTDPWLAALAMHETVKRIDTEASAAIALSKAKKLPSYNLEALVEASPSEKSDVLTLGNRWEGAIKELNAIRGYNPIGDKQKW
ncbi:hypothetical protein [Desulfomonile tiedjei]|uniref:Uncharacterized protein n=1 Tax=Desulfomonile tiedjei (strain ATCC 49306 / DSM 6799 / DCB-1) TaxID=706587 RepID=I4C5M9_DESTA|nr:hypothetical protein [Desulfomonile tiedjei]AFM24870.1 hypothetical protein Desti_2173 [Desulfomonile tiedjei DSM 6799]